MSTSFFEVNQKNFENLNNNEDDNDDGDIIVIDDVSSSEKNLSDYLNKSFLKSTPVKPNNSQREFYVKKSTGRKKDINSTGHQNSDYGSFNNNFSSSSNSRNKLSETEDDEIFDQCNEDSINNNSVKNSFKRSNLLLNILN